ncbi:MAG: alpha/beta fold hydrolase, partial [Billgrantia desiderata]
MTQHLQLPASAQPVEGPMFPGFQRTRIATSGAEINLVVGGEGPPLLLLHGNPLMHVSWHKVAPRLAQDYTVVAPDLRGYGDSSKPEGGPDHAAYSFRAMAEDQVEVMAALGFSYFRVAGHDRGGRVGHRLALDHPDCVEKLAVLDIVPTHHLLTHISKGWAAESYHWFFMAQAAP